MSLLFPEIQHEDTEFARRPTRPKPVPLPWIGGKCRLAKTIHSLAAPHKIRVIPFAGSLGELWTWPFYKIQEVVSDINPLVANFYWCMQDYSTVQEITREILLTPMSRHTHHYHISQYQNLLSTTENAKELARHLRNCPNKQLAISLLASLRMAIAGDYKVFRPCSISVRRGIERCISGLVGAALSLNILHRRIKSVEVLCEDASKVITTYDSKETLFYCDPPYPTDSRYSKEKLYAFEMTKEQHLQLLELLCQVKGKVMLSTYPNQLYDDFLGAKGWRRVEVKVNNIILNHQPDLQYRQPHKSEIIWMNY